MKKNKSIAKILDSYGIKPSVSGYYQLIDAIDIVMSHVKNGSILPKTMQLYETVGKTFDSNAYCVERTMRYAAHTAWARGGEMSEEFSEFPDLSEFICSTAYKVLMTEAVLDPIDCQIIQNLFNLGVKPDLEGTMIARDAIKIVMNQIHTGKPYGKFVVLYQEISKKHNVSAECAIRHAVAVAARKPSSLYLELFGPNPINASEFIARVAWNIELSESMNGSLGYWTRSDLDRKILHLLIDLGANTANDGFLVTAAALQRVVRCIQTNKSVSSWVALYHDVGESRGMNGASAGRSIRTLIRKVVEKETPKAKEIFGVPMTLINTSAFLSKCAWYFIE